MINSFLIDAYPKKQLLFTVENIEIFFPKAGLYGRNSLHVNLVMMGLATNTEAEFVKMRVHNKMKWDVNPMDWQLCLLLEEKRLKANHSNALHV